MYSNKMTKYFFITVILSILLYFTVFVCKRVGGFILRGEG